MADEADFIELVIASERVGKWIQEIKENRLDEPRLQRVVQELEKAVLSSEAYAGEAVLAGAVPLLASLLGQTEYGDGLKSSVANAVEACGRATKGKVSCFEYGGVSVLVKEGALSDGLGARMWEIAHIINRYLAARPGLFSGKNVLEIGSGCGSTGILAAKLGATKVVLTDCVDSVLQNLRECVHLNAGHLPDSVDLDELDDASTVSDLDFDGLTLQDSSDSPQSWDSGNMSVRCLDWSESISCGRDIGGGVGLMPKSDASGVSLGGGNMEGPQKVGFGETFAVIIGTDVMYEWEHSVMVAAVIAHRLAKGGRCLISGAVRDQGIHDNFMRECQSRGLQVDSHNIPTPESMKAREYEGGFVMMAVDWVAQPSWKNIQWKPDASTPL